MAQTPLNTLLDHRAKFLGFLRRRVVDDASAEDILQAAYLRAFNHEGELHEQETVVGWFYRVLRNAVIDHYRRNATESAALEGLGREMATAVVPGHEVNNEVCACLMKVLDDLTPGYAEILRAVELGEQPLADFARQNDITPTNAGVRVHRARAALRKHLLRCCGACAEHACIDCTCRADRAAARKFVSSLRSA